MLLRRPVIKMKVELLSFSFFWVACYYSGPWHVAAKAHVDRPEWIRPDRYTEIFIVWPDSCLLLVIIQMIPLMLASHMLASLERYNSSLWRFGIYFVVMLCAKTFPYCKTMRCIAQLQSSWRTWINRYWASQRTIRTNYLHFVWENCALQSRLCGCRHLCLVHFTLLLAAKCYFLLYFGGRVKGRTEGWFLTVQATNLIIRICIYSCMAPFRGWEPCTASNFREILYDKEDSWIRTQLLAL